MMKSTVYKKFPTRVEYFLSFLRAPLKRKTGINDTFVSTLHVDTSVHILCWWSG